MNNEQGIVFTCGCPSNEKKYKAILQDGKTQVVEELVLPQQPKEWFIKNSDEKGITEQPTGASIIHKCNKIIVYQRGLKRYFQKL